MKQWFKSDNKQSSDYFNAAQSWADDYYCRVEQSKARYQASFLASMGLNALTVLAVLTLANTQKLMPIAIHHYDNGITTVEPVTKPNAPINRAQIESDIVRYIQHREAFDMASYRYQFDLVRLLSANNVMREYTAWQNAKNETAPVNALGNKYTRSVHVFSVNFLDNVLNNQNDLHKNHGNLAEVVFSLTDTDKNNGNQVTEHYSAMLSWQFIKPSESPHERWQNFDGFQVVSYQKQLRNIQQG